IPNEAPRPGAPPSTFLMYGAAMAAAGDQLIVGAPLENRFGGAVHVVTRNGAEWSATQRLVPAETGRLQFGVSLTASPRLLVVGAPAADNGEGLAFVYSRSGTGSWEAAGKLVDKPFSMTAVTGGKKDCQSGKADEWTCQEVDLLAYLPIDQIGGGRGVHLNDIWGWTDPSNNREYALVGRVDGTAFVDVTDPSNPRYLGNLPLTEGAQPAAWRDIKVYKDHAFIVADGAGQHGMQVFDLTRLRNVANPPADFKPDTVYDKIASAHNIVINEATGFAYSVGNSAGGETCGGALHMIDIRDPRHPAFAGCFADKATGRQKTGYTHDAMCVNYHGPDARYTGKELCFNASETAVGIADVTDKNAPVAVAVAEYPNTAYAHQGWISEDHKYFFLNDELDELSGGAEKTRTMVWDVSKLDEPVLVNQFLGNTAATDHNMYVRGRYLYQSNYVAGLRILDIADPAHPVEVGYFDTVPWGENTPGFDGSWSNYPYFKSGTILISSIGQGLFIVKHRQMSPVP
ncbi:MAG: choice-of-anchor B family protein, partial [Gemmatimonadales bacterium]